MYVTTLFVGGGLCVTVSGQSSLCVVGRLSGVVSTLSVVRLPLAGGRREEEFPNWKVTDLSWQGKKKK